MECIAEEKSFIPKEWIKYDKKQIQSWDLICQITIFLTVSWMNPPALTHPYLCFTAVCFSFHPSNIIPVNLCVCV